MLPSACLGASILSIYQDAKLRAKTFEDPSPRTAHLALPPFSSSLLLSAAISLRLSDDVGLSYHLGKRI
ncbi:uncharacterized protein CLUP02_02675 [Colletotrichum lupini]|uniref:Uncharacterized protein n=1 Tax=Colletotrichum lupini TaxID=145971 RepID=A0A9Q8SHG8_9PEZI|nr:uncharacterized protein CLUP02_02675 [Colletotrichum lupini]UQC77208.1 hypothetical protein CLUP02_02675 [Colletotrichum lupini]